MPPKDHQSVCQHRWLLAPQVTVPCQAMSILKTKHSCYNQKTLKGCFWASQQYFCSSLLQPQRQEKRQNVSPETKQRLPWMLGASPPNTRPPKQSTFHNLNFVFSLLCAHWPPFSHSPSAASLATHHKPLLSTSFIPGYADPYIIHTSTDLFNHINADWHSFWMKKN